MPQFRNVRNSRLSGKHYPIEYGKDGWPLPECVEPLIQHIVKEEPLDDDDLEFTYPPSPGSARLAPDVKPDVKPDVQPDDSCPKSEPTITSFPADTPLPPRRNSHTRRRDSTHAPRPRNAFIFFRSHYINTCRDDEDQQNELSKLAGKVWNKMSKEERLPFVAMAEREKEEHMIRYPEYKYSPGRGRIRARPKASGRRSSGISAASRRKASMASSASSNDCERAVYPGSGSSETPSPALSSPVPPRAPRIRRVAALRAVQKLVEPSPSASPSIAPLSDDPVKPEARSASPPSSSSEIGDFVPTSEIPVLVLDPSQPMNKAKKEETPEPYNHTTLPCGMDYIQEQSGFIYGSRLSNELSSLPPLPDLKAFKFPAAAFNSFNIPWPPSMAFSALPGEDLSSLSTSSYNNPGGSRQLSPPSFPSLSDQLEPSLFKDLDASQLEFETLDSVMDLGEYFFESETLV